MEVEFNKENCFNIYFDTEGNISYTRLIDNKLWSYRATNGLEIGVIETLSALCAMDNKTFILLCSISRDCEGGISD